MTIPTPVCRRCSHRGHRGNTCQYPVEVLKLDSVPVARCGCDYQSTVWKGRSFKKTKVRAT